MSSFPATAPDAVATCPVCLRSLRRPHKCKTLYNVKVCHKCRNGFANRRQAAYLVDAVLYTIISHLVLFAIVPLRVGPAGRAGQQTVFFVAGLAVLQWLVLPFLFTMKDAFNGRSPGKLLFGVRVVDVITREPVTVGQSIKRNLVLMIPYVGVIGAIITMMRGQRWGDQWANCMVIWNKYEFREPFSPSPRYCRGCGYDLTGNVTGRCPECGLEILEWEGFSAAEQATPSSERFMSDERE